MLNKSILLNLNMVKSDMGILAGVLITFLVLLLIGINSFAFPVVGCLSIYLVIRLIIFVRIINKVFFTSFFDQEGTMYMTLPITAKDMIWGKILSTSGYFFVIDILFMIGSFSVILIAGATADDLLTSLSSDLPSPEGSPIELTLSFGLLPLSIFAPTLWSSALMLAIFLKFGLQKKKLLPCWIIYLIISKIISFGIDQMGKMLENITLGSIVDSIIGITFYIGFAAFLVNYSVKSLEQRYDV